MTQTYWTISTKFYYIALDIQGERKILQRTKVRTALASLDGLLCLMWFIYLSPGDCILFILKKMLRL